MAGIASSITVTPTFMEIFKKLGRDIDRGFEFGMTSVVTDIEARAVKKAPVVTSNLLNSITSFVANSGLTGVVKATAPYAAFVHDGTGLFGPKKKKFTILPKNKKALFWPGARHPVKKVVHSGQKAQPFLQDALDETDLQGQFEEGMQNFLNRRGY